MVDTYLDDGEQIQVLLEGDLRQSARDDGDDVLWVGQTRVTELL